MAIQRYETAGVIINDVLPECGLDEVIDAFSSGDPAVRQMSKLLTTCGRQLITLFGWQAFQKEHVIVTQPADSGIYSLPDDFDHMIDQTGWSRDQRVVLPGSVRPQVWQYLKGRNLVSSTIYLIFREFDNSFQVYPQPPDAAVPSPLTLAFEYVSKGWVFEPSSSTYKNRAESMGEIIQFNPLLISRMLKLRFKEARGQDTMAANNEFLQVFTAVSGQDVGQMSINVAGMSQPFPYLDMHRNTPDTGFGF